MIENTGVEMYSPRETVSGPATVSSTETVLLDTYNLVSPVILVGNRFLSVGRTIDKQNGVNS